MATTDHDRPRLINVADEIPKHVAELAVRMIGHHRDIARTAVAAIEAGEPEVALVILRAFIGGDQ